MDGPLEYRPGEVAHVPITAREDRATDWLELGGGEADFKAIMATVAASGFEAEKKYLLENELEVNERQLFRGAHGDVEQLRDLVGAGHWSAYCDAARAIIERPPVWQAITRLAAALIASWPAPLSETDAYAELRAVEPAQPLLKP